MLVGLLLLFAAAEGVLAGLASGIWESLPPAWYGTLAYRTMSLAGTAAAALGLFGLVSTDIGSALACSLCNGAYGISRMRPGDCGSGQYGYQHNFG